ncbi:MAG: chorismate synthase [Ruminococcaceae bacterium]|nr:chorismate synthase [Oscillospiraceae bacterium]
MKNTLGNSVAVTVFGESHGNAVGAVIDGLPAGIEVNEAFIAHQLDLRRPYGKISTPRQEADKFTIESGVFNNKTTGTPICILIPNENTKSKDYSKSYGLARPGHADFTAFSKYNGNEDYRGGGHFSGRITAGIVAAGAIAIDALNKKGIKIATHIKKCAGVEDSKFTDYNSEIDLLNKKLFAVIDDSKGEEMIKNIEKAALQKDSVGGVLETVVLGLPTGVGEPWFDSVESMLSHALFGVPAVKGIEFGCGFQCADMLGSEMNDAFYIENDIVKTKTNNNGGINGGITNGMPVTFKCAVKPTPSIAKSQETINFKTNENTDIEISGRHDPCIVHRARVVVDSITALVLCDLLAQKFGTDWLGEK